MKRIAKYVNENFKKLRSIKEGNFDDPRVGKRVELIETTDPYTDLEPEDQGKVVFVDDKGTLFVDWDDKGNLGLIPGEDKWSYLD